MVGYNFQVMFEQQIRALAKRQTVRADRKRHARPGEPIQLFCDQRSRRCRKLLTPDPICTAVRRVEIAIHDLVDELVASILIDGIPLGRDEIEAFARADGFGPEQIAQYSRFPVAATARANMGAFWKTRHGLGRFEGVLITWEPQ